MLPAILSQRLICSIKRKAVVRRWLSSSQPNSSPKHQATEPTKAAKPMDTLAAERSRESKILFQSFTRSKVGEMISAGKEKVSVACHLTIH
jgi:hypothetical protein